MKYPNTEQIEKADIIQLVIWYRFLKSPGFSAIGQDNFIDVQKEEMESMSFIMNRIKEAGGITSKISREVGWDVPSY
jgi:hypothetical protein